eukprot:Selendium_serpulae@DN5721_c1_g1_i1.p1
MTITAPEHAGLARGMATVHNLLGLNESGADSKHKWRQAGATALYWPVDINGVQKLTIKDAPSYPVRGLMIDTARWYLPVDDILNTLYMMYRSKLNVLHWHIVDDESFPLLDEATSVTDFVHGKGTRDGATGYHKVYNKTDIELIIHRANEFGIRVIFEVPATTGVFQWDTATQHFEASSGCGYLTQGSGFKSGVGEAGRATAIAQQTALFNYLGSLIGYEETEYRYGLSSAVGLVSALAVVMASAV